MVWAIGLISQYTKLSCPFSAGQYYINHFTYFCFTSDWLYNLSVYNKNWVVCAQFCSSYDFDVWNTFFRWTSLWLCFIPFSCAVYGGRMYCILIVVSSLYRIWLVCPFLFGFLPLQNVTLYLVSLFWFLLVSLSRSA